MIGDIVSGGLLVAVGVGAGGYYVRAGLKARAAQRWPPVEGTVSEFRLDEMRTRLGPRYAPVMTYRYTVNGQSYSGHRLAFGDVAEMKGIAETWVERYKVGSPVPVYVDPSNPGEAVLEPRMWGDQYMVLVSCAAVSLIGVLMILRGVR